jgi:3-oxoacyl-[acyl-carrier protein] reductase
MNLEGKAGIVTGAGRGIGRGIALLMAKEGAGVIVNDPGAGRNGEATTERPADEVVEEIAKAGGKALANYDSVANYASAGRMVRQCAETFGKIDFVVNAAGVLRERMIWNMTEDDFDAVISVHLKGTWNMAHHAIKLMRGERFGRIVNFSSDAFKGSVGQCNYAAAKAGVIGLTRTIARECGRYGITANAMCPFAATRMTVNDAVIANWKRRVESGLLTQAEFEARMATDGRISKGKVLLNQYKPIFDRVKADYGVPGPVLISFWALETDFGGNIGDLPTLISLATLAWDCRRPEKFRPQLLAALDLVGKGDLPVDQMRGAWAGEIGQTQFLAKEYDEIAVDADGDGRRDLRKSLPDVMASSGALLVHHGWKANQPWLEQVTVPKDMPWQEADIAIQHPAHNRRRLCQIFAKGGIDFPVTRLSHQMSRTSHPLQALRHALGRLQLHHDIHRPNVDTQLQRVREVCERSDPA